MPAAGKGGEFGLKMKRAREERGVSLRHIAEVTKISISALEALERSDVSRLPGGIFSRAFVRSYALEVGLDPEQTVREFLTLFPDDTNTAGSAQEAYEEIAGTGSRRWGLPGVLLTLLVIALVIGGILFLTVGSP
jgi:cytoskeletal protein RodZ